MVFLFQSMSSHSHRIHVAADKEEALGDFLGGALRFCTNLKVESHYREYKNLCIIELAHITFRDDYGNLCIYDMYAIDSDMRDSISLSRA